MAERLSVKPRTCNKCGAEIMTTALGIQEHAATCSQEKTSNE